MSGRLVLALLVSAVSCASVAVEVSVAEAERAVRTWLRADPSLGSGLGGETASARTCTSPGGARFHVVRLKEGGFVVTSADTSIEPVIAFSRSDDLIESETNPLWSMLTRDLEGRTVPSRAATAAAPRRLQTAASPSAAEAKWARLLSDDVRGTTSPGRLRLASAASEPTSVSDVRVAPLVQSRWGQRHILDRNGATNDCFNLYTPHRTYCGCVATAGGQIMRFFEWPKTALPSRENAYCSVDGDQTTLTMAGGVYRWDLMPLDPQGEGASPEQCEAIGRLTADIGIACGTKYTKDEAGAGSYMLGSRLTDWFGYGNAVVYQRRESLSTADIRRVLLSNLDAGLPVLVSVRGGLGGHDIVADGYGYSDGSLFYHLNMGWYGTDDAWYALPAFEAQDGMSFDIVDGFVYNIYTNAAQKGFSICSGRVLDASGVPVAGATVFARDERGSPQGVAVTGEKGIYALVLPPGTYVLAVDCLTSAATLQVRLDACVSTDTTEDGYFYPSTGTIGNSCDNDLVLSGVETVAPPQIAPSSCPFHPSVPVRLSCPVADAEIRYTLDGQVPTEDSPLYSGTILLTKASGTTTVKARAFKRGLLSSTVVSETFVYESAKDSLPVGNDYANPILIRGASGRATVTATDALTMEDGEHNTFSNYDNDRSAWFFWRAPGSGEVEVRAWSSNAEPGAAGFQYVVLDVYAGDTLAEARRVAYMDPVIEPTGAVMRFAAEQNVAYRLRVSAIRGYANGLPYELSWSGSLVTEPLCAKAPVDVPYAWLDEHYPMATDFSGMGCAIGVNGRPHWESYLLGFNPTALSGDVKILSFRLDGTRPVLEWNVDDARLESLGYRRVIRGKTTLDAAWQELDADRHRFFRIFVEKGD